MYRAQKRWNGGLEPSSVLDVRGVELVAEEVLGRLVQPRRGPRAEDGVDREHLAGSELDAAASGPPSGTRARTRPRWMMKSRCATPSCGPTAAGPAGSSRASPGGDEGERRFVHFVERRIAAQERDRRLRELRRLGGRGGNQGERDG